MMNFKLVWWKKQKKNSIFHFSFYLLTFLFRPSDFSSHSTTRFVVNEIAWLEWLINVFSARHVLNYKYFKKAGESVTFHCIYVSFVLNSWNRCLDLFFSWSLFIKINFSYMLSDFPWDSNLFPNAFNTKFVGNYVISVEIKNSEYVHNSIEIAL